MATGAAVANGRRPLLTLAPPLAVTSRPAGARPARSAWGGTALYDPRRHHTQTFRPDGVAPGVRDRPWLLGTRTGGGRHRRRPGWVRAGSASGQALALRFAAMVHQCGRPPPPRCIGPGHRRDQGFVLYRGTVLRGWARRGRRSGGGSSCCVRIDAWQATGSVTYRPLPGSPADMLARDGPAAATCRYWMSVGW